MHVQQFNEGMKRDEDMKRYMRNIEDIKKKSSMLTTNDTRYYKYSKYDVNPNILREMKIHGRDI